MSRNVIRQLQKGLANKHGLRRITSVLMQHKKLTAVGFITLAVAAIPVASEVFAESSEPSPRQQTASQQSIQSQNLPQQNDRTKQPAVTKEDQPMKSDVNINSSKSSEGENASDVDVTVNGQHIPVPQNGSVHKRMTDESGESIVDIQVDNQSDAYNSSSSSTVIIEQHSYSTGSETDNTGGTSRHPDRR